MPPDQSTDLENLLHGLPARDEIQPPVVSRPQVLPFNQLSWENFERLCTRLIATDSDVVDCHRYGKRGDYQAGIDILAHCRTPDGGQERWGYQCKRWQKITPGELRLFVAEFHFPANRYVLLISLEATAELRGVAADLLETDLWDAEDISSQLKNKLDLVEDFFGAHWREAFCTVDPLVSRALDSTDPADLVAELTEWKVIHNDSQALLNSMDIPLGYLTAYRFKPNPENLDEAGYKWQELCVPKLKSILHKWNLQYAHIPALEDVQAQASSLILNQITRQLMQTDIGQPEFRTVLLQLVELRGTLWNILTAADKRIMVLVEALKL